MKFLLLILLIISLLFVSGHVPGAAAPEARVQFLFLGDVMGHSPQIDGAWNSLLAAHDYASVFCQVAPLIRTVDFAIANLEVTLAGPPYTGYPRFSSPDALAAACREIGVDVLTTANNHICDRGVRGITRTIGVLDSLGIASTGSFRTHREMLARNPLILEKNGIRVGLLNYTYGTNGLPTPFPAVVNRIDTVSIAADLRRCRNLSLDKLIVMLHWGSEYRSLPNRRQRETADFFLRHGVDIIIGSHPHVIQPLTFTPGSGKMKQFLVAWSLGNYVSNQRQTRRDGGMTLFLELTKTDSLCCISDCGYYLTWVRRDDSGKNATFSVLPCSIYEEREYQDLSPREEEGMRRFLEDTRALMQHHTLMVEERKFSDLNGRR